MAGERDYGAEKYSLRLDRVASDSLGCLAVHYIRSVHHTVILWGGILTKKGHVVSAGIPRAAPGGNIWTNQ